MQRKESLYPKYHIIKGRSSSIDINSLRKSKETEKIPSFKPIIKNRNRNKNMSIDISKRQKSKKDSKQFEIQKEKNKPQNNLQIKVNIRPHPKAENHLSSSVSNFYTPIKVNQKVKENQPNSNKQNKKKNLTLNLCPIISNNECNKNETSYNDTCFLNTKLAETKKTEEDDLLNDQIMVFNMNDLIKQKENINKINDSNSNDKKEYEITLSHYENPSLIMETTIINDGTIHINEVSEVRII